MLMAAWPAIGGPSASSSKEGARSGLVQQRGDLARDAEDAEAARQVRRQLDVEHDVAEDVLQRRAGPVACVVLQQHDALVLVRESQLLFGADHASVGDAAQRAFLQTHAPRFCAVAVPKFCAFHGEGRPPRRLQRPLVTKLEEVARAGDALLQLVTAVIHHGQHEPVGVGVGAHLADGAQQDLVARPYQVIRRRPAHALHCALWQAQIVDGADLEAGQGQAFGEQLDRDVDVDQLAQPGKGNQHYVLLMRNAGGRDDSSDFLCRRTAQQTRRTWADINQMAKSTGMADMGPPGIA